MLYHHSRPMLSRDQAKRYYERNAHKQDAQAFYEDPALEQLIAQGQFGAAERVFELGCGTGRLAAQLFGHLPESAEYVGCDLSRTMVERARARLAPFEGRAQVLLTDGSLPWPLASGSVDRVVVSYVLDLLPDAEIEAVLAEAARILKPAGFLCLANLTGGVTPLSRLNMWRWRLLYRLNPLWVGGCRPLSVQPRLEARTWRLWYHEVVVAAAVPSEVLIAKLIAKPLTKAAHGPNEALGDRNENESSKYAEEQDDLTGPE